MTRSVDHNVPEDRASHVHAVLLLVSLDPSDTEKVAALRQLSHLTVTPAQAAGAEPFQPIQLDELLASIETLTQGDPPGKHNSDHIVRVDDLSINLDARIVRVGDHKVSLTRTEFELLAVLARHVGRAVRRQEIMRTVWGISDFAISRVMDVHLTALRAKLDRPGLIHTVRGYGYRLGEPRT